jgi:hypothetical protein
MTAQKYVSPPIPLPVQDEAAASPRAVIQFSGVEQAGPSFEARVFLNNPQAGPDTPKTPESGYAGSFHVYGYGVWPGEQKEAPENGVEEGRKGGARAPTVRTLVATEPLRRAAEESAHATVTVVPVLPGGAADPSVDLGDILKIDQVSIHAAPE